MGRPRKPSDRHKHQMVLHITQDPQSHRLSVALMIKDLKFEVAPSTLKRILKDLDYNHRITWLRPFLKKLDCKRRLQFGK
jgi:hypothetical protein